MTTPVPTLRERLLEAAVELTSQAGWAQVTMARLGQAVGVSRQTVYNEIGARPLLAEAMVLRELDRFLALVDAAFDQSPDDLVAALHSACLAVLDLAQDNPLLHAIVSATQGADTELLPLLTTHSASLLDAAKIMVLERSKRYAVAPADPELDGLVDAVVRLVLSHIMQPAGSPERAADTIAWIVGRALGTRRGTTVR